MIEINDQETCHVHFKLEWHVTSRFEWSLSEKKLSVCAQHVIVHNLEALTQAKACCMLYDTGIMVS